MHFSMFNNVIFANAYVTRLNPHLLITNHILVRGKSIWRQNIAQHVSMGWNNKTQRPASVPRVSFLSAPPLSPPWLILLITVCVEFSFCCQFLKFKLPFLALLL